MEKIENMMQRLLEMQEKARLKNKQERISGAPLPSNVVQLPLWPEPVRAIPNGFLRSALFGAVRKGRQRYLKDEKLAALDTIEIYYTGERLNQGDLDVYESLLHAVRLQEMGSQCRLTSYTLLKLMGKTNSGSNRVTLDTRITRLRANAVRIRQGRYTYIGGLIDEGYKDEKTKEWIVVLNPKILVLYGKDQFTHIQWAVRHALNGKPLAQWLHGFYSSHAKPFPMKIVTLHSLCGSEAKRISDYKIDLRNAMDDVAEASIANGETFSYEICGNLVYVERKASTSQKRHLEMKKSKAKRAK